MQWSESQGSSRSLGLSGQASESSSSSTTQVQETKRTVLASEIGALPDLEGFLRTPGAPIGYVHLPYAKLPAVADAFVAGEAGVLRSAPPAATLP